MAICFGALPAWRSSAADIDAVIEFATDARAEKSGEFYLLHAQHGLNADQRKVHLIDWPAVCPGTDFRVLPHQLRLADDGRLLLACFALPPFGQVLSLFIDLRNALLDAVSLGVAQR